MNRSPLHKARRRCAAVCVTHNGGQVADEDYFFYVDLSINNKPNISITALTYKHVPAIGIEISVLFTRTREPLC